MKLPDYSLEKAASKRNFRAIAGIDEAGRGPGAGPVVAAAVVIPYSHVDMFLKAGKIRDSKKVSAKWREEVYKDIIEQCDYGIGVINNDIIDEINVLEATKLAMIAAINGLKHCDYLLIDGNMELNLPHTQQSVIKGDSISISIAAASILAKVTRDEIMCDLHGIFPIYDWNKNKGYLTKGHIKAINMYGITEFHRLSFKRVGG